MATPTFTKTGSKAASAAKLDKNVFDVEVNGHELVKSVYDAYLANGRENLAVVKTRGLVSGGGKKPWKQKGTGRARFGSSRNPIWRGGGIVFGPTGEENYSKHVNGKSKLLATRQALTLAARSEKIVVVEAIDPTVAKTAELAGLFAKVGAIGRLLVVVENKTAELVLASRNLPNVKIVQPSYANVFDIMNADTIVMTEGALADLSKRLGGDK